MKRMVTAMAVLIAAAGILSAGEVSVSLEAKTNVWSQNVTTTTKDQGFNIVSGDDYLTQLYLGYDSDFGGGFARFRLNAKGDALGLDRWNMYIKPIQQVKFSMGTAPYEVFAESINWEPIFGAGLFEFGAPKAIVEVFPVAGLTIMGGIPAVTETGAYGLTDKPFSAFEGAVKYDIGGVGSFAVEYSNAAAGQSGFGVNGDIKRVGVQFNYTGVEKLSALVGYSAVLASGDAFDTANKALKAANQTELASLAQNRIEAFVTYSGIDKVGLSLYEAAILRGAGWGDMGNRVAVKLSYQATDKLSIWTRENFFMNYGPQTWGTHGGTLA